MSSPKEETPPPPPFLGGGALTGEKPAEEAPVPKRLGRGRLRKDPNAPKAKPKKATESIPHGSEESPATKRGRNLAEKYLVREEGGTEPPKRHRGRPRKIDKPTETP